MKYLPHLSSIGIYLQFFFLKFKSNHQESLENIIQVKFDKKKFEYTKIHKRQNDRKRILKKSARKFKMKEQKKSFLANFSKTIQILCFLGFCDFHFNFFAIFSKMRHSISTLPVILSFINNVLYLKLL